MRLITDSRGQWRKRSSASIILDRNRKLSITQPACRRRRPPAGDRVTGPWGFYDLPAVYGQYVDQPELNLLEGQVTVSTNFYSTQSAILVCTLTTTVKDLTAMDSAVAAVANAIAARLHSDGLVK